jgi:hypothetical protein
MATWGGWMTPMRAGAIVERGHAGGASSPEPGDRRRSPRGGGA